MIFIPRLADIGHERPGHDRVATHGRAEGAGQPRSERVEAGLRRRVGQHVRARPDGGRAGDVDDRPACARGHPGADQRGKPEGAFQVHRDYLVEQVLGQRSTLS